MIALTGLIRDGSNIPSCEVERAASASARLAEALASEAHAAIAHYDSEQRFWFGLIAARLAEEAISRGDVPLAEQLHVWARDRNVPAAHRNTILNALLAP